MFADNADIGLFLTSIIALSVYFRSATHHCWIGRSRVLLLLVSRKSLSSVDLMLSSSKKLYRSSSPLHDFATRLSHTYSESKWSKPGSGMKIVPIMTAKETFSPGDAMRDIYTRGLVTSDFVLVMGDLVSNIRIDEVVRVHKERRRTNKDAIMTMVVKESGIQHRTRWGLGLCALGERC